MYSESEANTLLAKVNWKDWLYKPGDPLVTFDFRRIYYI